MELIKAMTVEEEVKKKVRQEREEEIRAEVMAIRRAIMELFNTEPGKGFSNNEIYEWLIDKSINISRRQINPKMQMMKNIFYQEYGNPKNHGVWFRRVCSVCKRPLELDDKFREFPERHLMGHSTCIEFISKLIEEHTTHLHEWQTLLASHQQQILELTHENSKQQEEIKKLRSMVEFPSDNPNPQARRIVL